MSNNRYTLWIAVIILAAMAVTIVVAVSRGPIRPGVGNASQLPAQTSTVPSGQ